MELLDRITKEERALFLAYDQGLEHGPTDFTDVSVDPAKIFELGLAGKCTGIIVQKGIAQKYYWETSVGRAIQTQLPLIIKLNGKTNLLQDTDPYAPLLCTVAEAKTLGAVAVGYTVYVGSEFESKMTEEFAAVIRDSHEEGMPVIGWMYPRGRHIPDPHDEIIVAYASRLGLELGADMVKMQYPHTQQAMRHAVQAAGKTKVVISGGTKTDEASFLQLATDIMATGAIGMAVGRNIWQQDDPLSVIEKLKSIIFAKDSENISL